MPLPAEINDIRNKLRKAAIDCSSRGIIYASKWAAEMLDNLVKEDDIDGSNSSLFGPTNTFGQAKASSGATIDDNNDSDDDDIQKRQDMLEEDKYLLAKAYFDSREYERAAKCIEKCTGPRAWFLRIYSQYLSGEKRMKEALAEFKDNHERPNIVNDVLKDIMNELEQNKEHLDGFGLYLLGTIYAKQKSKKARDVLLESVQMYPHNWSAWLTLASCLDTRDLVENITPKLPQGIMRHFFLAHTTIETPPSNTPSTDLFSVHYNIVKQMFPKSPFVISMQAMRHYHCREFEEADSVFLELEEQDPYYIDHADIHSNILYVMEDRPQLGALAHRCSSIDMFRPETCCVVGNYYSLRGEHEKAVMYFKRALRLDRSYLSAWTLMGHEYMEMKNTSAAIQAYRRAIEVDERDYRAWYGLGQTYEMLKQPQYAFYYFKRAAALRPFDSRMWCALANCYEMSGQIDNAIACYERALCGSRESEQIATSRLGRLYESIGKDDTAAHYYKTLCDKIGKDDAHMEEISNALIFLARHQQKLGQPDVSEQYLRIVIDAQGPQTEAAKAMLRAIRSASTNKSDTSDRARPPNRAQLS